MADRRLACHLGFKNSGFRVYGFEFRVQAGFEARFRIIPLMYPNIYPLFRSGRARLEGTVRVPGRV